MVKAAFVFGCAAIASTLIGSNAAAHSAPLLQSYSHDGSATSSATSYDYRYVTFGSPRTGIHRGWRRFGDQYTNAGNAAPLNGSSGVQSSTGSFYGPAYAGSSFDTNTFSTSDTLSIFHVTLSAKTTMTTPKVMHQAVNASAAASDYFYFTLASDTDTRLEVKGTPNQIVQIIDGFSGEAIFTAYGVGTFHDILAAGDYAVRGSVAEDASQDTQYNLMSNLGVATASLDYKLTLSPPQ